MWYIPEFFDGIKVPVYSNPDLFENCCKSNVQQTIIQLGGTLVEGAYVLYDPDIKLYQFIRHYVWEDPKGELVDVTPFRDTRLFNVFVRCKINVPNIFSRDPEFYKYCNTQENEQMYYVYQYLDPDTKVPFYVGKGTQERAYIHLKTPSTIINSRFKNKIMSYKNSGAEPIISFIAVNIKEEHLAYEIEESYIKKYGRIGYDDRGTLLNVCESSRPPNHKGKSYKDIYGDDWEHQIEKRRQTQLKRGGFGPKQHSTKTKKILSDINKGEGNPRFGAIVSQETRDKISIANKGQRRSGATRYKLTNLTEEFVIQGTTDVIQFCKTNNISWSTLHNQLTKGWARAKKGKTKGWLIERI